MENTHTDDWEWKSNSVTKLIIGREVLGKYGQRLWDWGVSRGQKSSQVHGRTSLHFYEGIPGRKMDVKGNVDDGPERKQESWRESFHHVKPPW